MAGVRQEKKMRALTKTLLAVVALSLPVLLWGRCDSSGQTCPLVQPLILGSTLEMECCPINYEGHRLFSACYNNDCITVEGPCRLVCYQEVQYLVTYDDSFALIMIDTQDVDYRSPEGLRIGMTLEESNYQIQEAKWYIWRTKCIVFILASGWHAFFVPDETEAGNTPTGKRYILGSFLKVDEKKCT
jgi:hypothetical protein